MLYYFRSKIYSISVFKIILLVFKYKNLLVKQELSSSGSKLYYEPWENHLRRNFLLVNIVHDFSTNICVFFNIQTGKKPSFFSHASLVDFVVLLGFVAKRENALLGTREHSCTHLAHFGIHFVGKSIYLQHIINTLTN